MIVAVILPFWLWIKGRCIEVSSHFGFLFATATLTLEKAASMPALYAKPYLILAFLSFITPERKKPS